MTNDEMIGKTVKELVVQAIADIADVKERVIRMEEREKVGDDVRKQTCPWSSLLSEFQRQQTTDLRRIGALEADSTKYQLRIADLEKTVLTRETQGGLAFRIFEWAWKLGIIAVLARELAKSFAS